MQKAEKINEKYLFNVMPTFDEIKEKNSSIEVSLTIEYSQLVKGWIQHTAVFIRDHLASPTQRVSCKLMVYRGENAPILEVNINTIPQFTVIIAISGEFDLSQRYEKIHGNYCKANVITIKVFDFVDAFHIARLLLKYVEPETRDLFGGQILLNDLYIERHEQVRYKNAEITAIRSLPPQKKYVTYTCPHCQATIAEIGPNHDIRIMTDLHPFTNDIIELKIQHIIPVEYQSDKIWYAFAKKIECNQCSQLYLMFQIIWGYTKLGIEANQYMDFLKGRRNISDLQNVSSENYLVTHADLKNFWLSSLVENEADQILYEHTFGPYKIENGMNSKIRSQCMLIIDKAWPIVFL